MSRMRRGVVKGIIRIMKQGTFEKEIFIRSDIKTVLGVISEFSQHHKVHPLIVKVEQVIAPAGVLRRYFITDQLQWGLFKFKIRYRADILSLTENEVHTEAYQSPNTFVDNLTRVTPAKDGVLLKEIVNLKAPNLLFNYAFRQAQTAHAEMLNRIKGFVESHGGLGV